MKNSNFSGCVFKVRQYMYTVELIQ